MKKKLNLNQLDHMLYSVESLGEQNSYWAKFN